MRALRRVGWSAVAIALLFVPLVARAHTSFDYSSPADGEEVQGPLSEITVAFTEPVTVTGAGFEVLDDRGEIVTSRVESPDDAVFTLLLDSPIGRGEIGVRYEVAAADGHVLSGSFTFIVAAANTTRTTTTSSTATTDDPSTTTMPTTTTLATTGTVTAEPAGPGGSESDGGGVDTTVLVAGAAALAAGTAITFVARRSADRKK